MITVTLTAECPEHPEYTGTRVNKRVNGFGEDWCPACYDLYAIRHPNSKYADFDAEITIQEVKDGS